MTDATEKLNQIHSAFEELKSKQNEVIAEEVKKGTADVVRKNEVEAINTSITKLTEEMKALEAKASRPQIGEKGLNQDQVAHKGAFLKWVRKGADDGLGELESKALNVTTSADGGYAVPEELDRSILELLTVVSPFRGLANQITVGGSDYKKLVNLKGTGSGWVGETSARAETSSPTFAEVTPYMGEIYANPAATQRMLDDAFFPVEPFLAGEIADEFAKQEGTAFVAGDGTNKPKGFMTYTINTSADGVRTFGHLQKKITGVAGGFIATTSSSNPGNTFIDVIHSMKAPLRLGASWLMNSLTLAAVRKLTDLDGKYLWQPGLTLDNPSTILGYAVNEVEDMPDIATTSNPIAFGNWKRGYTVVDRMGVRLLRDPFTNKPFVQFYTTKRVGGMVVDSQAIKILSVSSN
ncbi:MAG: phage major capsid protein [Afipia sp.]|nr:phage major capsid protein [Afipia sp.]